MQPPLSSVPASRGHAEQPPNPAASALLEEASQQLESGQLDQAAATLERALRIEPDNAATLHYLGQVRLQQGQYQQAEALAARSNTRAGSNADLRHRNARLISAAQQSMDSNNADHRQVNAVSGFQTVRQDSSRHLETAIGCNTKCHMAAIWYVVEGFTDQPFSLL